jgi:hypothetical protein
MAKQDTLEWKLRKKELQTTSFEFCFLSQLTFPIDPHTCIVKLLYPPKLFMSFLTDRTDLADLAAC